MSDAAFVSSSQTSTALQSLLDLPYSVGEILEWKAISLNFLSDSGPKMRSVKGYVACCLCGGRFDWAKHTLVITRADGKVQEFEACEQCVRKRAEQLASAS